NRSASRPAGGTAVKSRAINTPPSTSTAYAWGVFASAPRPMAGFLPAVSGEGARGVRGAALPVQLHLPARRLASARAGGAGGLTRLCRARDHRRVLGRRRGACAHGGQEPAPEAHHRLGVSPDLRAQAGRARHRPARLRTAVPPHHPRPARGRAGTMISYTWRARGSGARTVLHPVAACGTAIARGAALARRAFPRQGQD